MPSNKAWGLDIGQCAVRMVKMERQKKSGVAITDFAVIPLDSPPEDPHYDEKVVKALAQIVREKGVGKTPVYISLPGFTTFFRDFTLPMMAAGKLHEIVSYEARQQIPYPLEEVLWGYHVFRANEESTEVNISLVCCRRDIVTNILLLLETVGLNIVGIQVGPLALANFILYDQPPEGVTLLLDAGARATGFIVLNNGNFWLRSIAVAGGDFNKALMSKFNLTFEEAEALKKKMGESRQADRVFQVIAPVLKTLCGELQRSIGFFKSQYRGTRLDSLICVGGTFLLPGGSEFVSEALGVPTRRQEELKTITFGPEVDAKAFQEQGQSIGTAVGLALQGTGIASVDINLLPQEIQRRQLIRKKLPAAVATVLLLLLLTVLNLSIAVGRSDRWSPQIKEYAGVAAQVDKNKAAYDAAEKEANAAIEKNRSLARIAEGRGAVLDFMGILWQKIIAINQARGKEVEAPDENGKNEAEKLADRFYQELINPVTMPMELKAQLGKEIDEAEREKTLAFIREQCAYRAKTVTDRRRRIVIDQDISITRKLLEWTVTEDKTLNIRQYYTPKEGQTRLNAITTQFPNKQEAQKKTKEFTDSLQNVPTEVLQLVLKGFVVSLPTEYADVISLQSEFAAIPGVHDVEITRLPPSTNQIIVLKYMYSQAEMYLSSLEALEDKDRSQDYIEYPESVYPFNMKLHYSPVSAMAEQQARKVREVLEEAKTAEEARRTAAEAQTTGAKEAETAEKATETTSVSNIEKASSAVSEQPKPVAPGPEG
ncbi:MAG: type IV pilus assembly protein PilM, partial [Planctomycetota bacterium]